MGFFDKLKELAQRSEPRYTKPARIDDPVADSVSWHPISKTGSPGTHIVFHSEATVVVSASLGMMVFPLFLGGMAAIAALAGVMGVADDLIVNLLLAGLGGSFMVGVYFLCRVYSKLLVFDRHKDSIYYEGDDSKSLTRISTVHAIQIIPTYYATPDGSYHSFQINLVLKNAERINVMNRGNKKAIDHDTHILQEFLSVPVWELSRHSNTSLP